MLSDFGLLRKSCSRRLTLTPMKVVIGYMPDYANPRSAALGSTLETGRVRPF